MPIEGTPPSIVPVDEEEGLVSVVMPLDEDTPATASDDLDSGVRSKEELVETGKENDCNGRDGCKEDDRLGWEEVTDPN